MPAQSQVLARKYRPQVFDDLIGQEALVRTITNAIQQNRLAQAYILTGIRGIGKTTSARIIAKGLNCIGEDGKGGMTPNPCGKCKHCQEIANDSHMDVIEIDAASNTGVDNVREIIESAKYNPVSARYKIYIIDEVHMLSKAAFNALLKTLEEPPEHVKFIFATTEIRKVPLTILSRCQRFDLKRISADVLTDYLSKICQKENKTFSHEALHLIAKAGAGSVRDSLSLLDQTFTQLPDNPSIEQVRQMLGAADKTALLQLYTAILNAQMETAFNELDKQYESGADALTLVQDMLDLTYKLTCLKVVPKATLLDDFTQNEQKVLKELAEQASMHTLTANWQILMKGIQEIRSADNPFQATQMLIIRMAYLSDIAKSPDQLLEEVKKKSENTPIIPASAASSAPFVPLTSQPMSTTKTTNHETQQNTSSTFKTLAEIADFARQKAERLLAFNIENYMHLISLHGTTLTCSLTSDTPSNFISNLGKFLREQTGSAWTIKVEKTGGTSTIKEQKETSQKQLLNALQKTPMIQEIEKFFPGAKIEKVKTITPAETETTSDTSKTSDISQDETADEES